MFEKILLPLDGSEVAENAIPYVSSLASKLGSEVVLVHACPPEHRHRVRMYQIYLDFVANNMKEQLKKFWQGSGEPKVWGQVLTGRQADVIAEFAKSKAINMVVMTSCGASGVKDSLGSVVNQVVRAVLVPTLIVRIKGSCPTVSQEVAINRILLPMDGSDNSKSAIPYAVELSKKLNANIMLYRMAETVYAHGMDGITAGVGVNWDQIDNATEKYVHTALEEVEKGIKEAGIETSHIVTIGIDPANEIISQEKKSKADLVVMSTRGRSPIARWAFGSVAEKILREGELPLLVVK